VVECHGSINFLQPFDTRKSEHIWAVGDSLDALGVNVETFLAEGALPVCPPAAGAAAGTLARPNILMFGDSGFAEARTDAQEQRMTRFLASLPREARVVVVEVGAGCAIPTVRYASENILDEFPNAQLLRINPLEADGPARTLSIAERGKAALLQLDAAIGGAAGIGADA
jgi:hypothetical protein